MSASLKGKVAWITGGGSGIGLAGAIELVKAGAHVVISGRTKATNDSAEKELKALGKGDNSSFFKVKLKSPFVEERRDPVFCPRGPGMGPRYEKEIVGEPDEPDAARMDRLVHRVEVEVRQQRRQW